MMRFHRVACVACCMAVVGCSKESPEAVIPLSPSGTTKPAGGHPPLDFQFANNPKPTEIQGDAYRFPSFGITLIKPKGYEPNKMLAYPGFELPGTEVSATIMRASAGYDFATSSAIGLMAGEGAGPISEEEVKIGDRQGKLTHCRCSAKYADEPTTCWILSVEANAMVARAESLVIIARYPNSQAAAQSETLKKLLLTAKIDPSK